MALHTVDQHEDKETTEWIKRMEKDSQTSDMISMRAFTEKYSRNNGCPFDTEVVYTDTDSAFVRIKEHRPKRKANEITHPRPKRDPPVFQTTRGQCESIARAMRPSVMRSSFR